MPDLKQALRDFIATSNSGKYADEATLLSKFPELSGYDIQSLRDFVATSNSGKYKTEDEVFSKFPEFSIGAIQQPINVKKNNLPIGGEDLQDGFDFSQPAPKAPSVLTPQAQEKYIAEQEQKPVKIPVEPPTSDTIPKGFQTYQAPSEEETQGYSKNFLDNLSLGVNNLARVVATIPKAAYNVFSLPQNALAWATGLDISTNANKFGKTLGIENPILKQLDEEDKVLNERIQKFNKTNYEDSSVYENIKLGNYGDAFELMGSGIAQSAPVSLAMMYGGATLTAPQLVAAGTIAFEEGSRDQLEEDSPNMPEIEKTIKALAMSSAETVFSSIGTGTIGQVYRDIIKKEGVEAGKVLFKDGLVEMYKGALKKYGAPIGLLGEGIEEAATQITQNLISGRPAFEGAADAFIIGGGSGVAFSAPINIIQAKEQINNIVETNKSKSDINTILKDNTSELHQIFNVSQAEPFTSEQIQIANTNKSRDVLVKNLAKNVKDGVITDEDAKQSVYIFDKAQQVSNAVKKLDVDNDKKTQIANLLSKRNNLKTEIETQDDALVVKQKQEVNNINQQISDIILNSKPVSETVVVEAPEIAQQRVDRIAEIETALAPESTVVIKNAEKAKLQTELETLKLEQDAIQKQTAAISLEKERLEKNILSEKEYLEGINNKRSRFYKFINKVTGTTYDKYLKEQQSKLELLNTDPLAFFNKILAEEIEYGKKYPEDDNYSMYYEQVINDFKIKTKSPPQEDAIQIETAGQVPVLTEAGVGEEVVQREPQAEPEVVTKEGVQEEVGKGLAVIVDPVNIELKNNKIEGKLFNEQEAKDYQELIESKYNDSEVVDVKKRFGQGNEDIRARMFNYDNAYAEKDVNGVNVRIAEGLLEGVSGNKKRTYLLYADGKIAGKFYSVSDAKKVVDFIEANLVKSLPTQEVTPTQQLKAEKPIVSEEAVSENIDSNEIDDEDGDRISEFKVGDIIEKGGKKYEILGNSKKENTGVVKLRNIDTDVVNDWNAENNGGFKLSKEQTPAQQVKAIEPAATERVAPKEGDTVTLPPRIKDGDPYIMVFKNGSWKQKSYGNYYRVKLTMQTEAQNAFDQQNNQTQETPKAEEVVEPTIDLKKGDTVIWEGKESAILSTLKFGNEIKYNIDNGKEGGVWTNLITLKSESKKGLKAEKVKPTRTVAEIEKDQRALMAKYNDALKEAGIYELAVKNEADPAEIKKIRDRFKKDADKLKAEKESLTAEVEKPAAPVKAKPVVTETIDDLLDLDVADQDNLDKIFNALDNADKNIGKRLRTGANDALLAIPLGTIRVVIKAIKALVKGGMLLRDAIKKVAADNNLTESQVSDVLNIAVKESSYSDLSVEDTYEKYHVTPESGHTKIDVKGSEPIKKGQTFGTVTYSNKEEGDVVSDSFSINDIDKLSNRSSGFITTARNIAQGFISIKPSPKDITEQLFGKGKNYQNLSDANKTKVDKERIKQTTQFKLPWSNNKALASLNAYINKNKDNKPSDYYNVVKQKSKDIINSFKEEVKNNLRALYNNVSEDFRETSRQWYDGANRLAQSISKSYGISLEQSAGILAALSPKNNWFNNISAAERVIRAWADHQNTTVTQEMVDRTIAYMERNGEAPFAKDIRAVFSDTKGIPISELVEEYKKTNNPKILTQIGITMRIIDQSEYSPTVYSVSPEGFIDGKYGVIGWSGGAALTNAVSMLIDPSMKNISSRLGNGNKVRNFYGNIIDPQNPEFLTADTHAFAAGLMLPASANEAQDFGLFDGGTSVEYAIFKDAYIEVAKEFGILPREMQSITWEAVRGSINTDNRTPSMVKDINRISEELLTNGESNENRTNEILKKYPIKFSKGEWSNKRGIEAQKRILGGNGGVSQTADTGRGTTVFGNLRGQDTQVGGEVTGGQGIEEVLDLDVTDKDNLDKVFGFLDNADKSIGKILKGGANEAMLAIPLNVVRVAIKTLKALVQGGMLLRDAIKKVAADNNISQESVKDILNIAPIQEDFNSLMDEVDKRIARQKSRGIVDSKIISNIDTFIRKRDEYLNANDAQKKIIEREARAKMGAAPKRAVSIGRVLGALKDITNISRQEKLKIISQIRKLSKDAAKDLAKEIRAMASSGKITPVQAANIIARFGNVNMLNEVSVSNFVDYMAKVFANAEYANKIDVAKSKLKNARQNIATKIGIADGIVGPLQRLFSINPALIPNLYLDRYLDLVNMFSARQAVLTLEDKSVVKSGTEAILREIDAEQSKADELADRFNNSENKVFKDNVLDYAASIRKMLEEDEIDQNEADIMRKYKSDIAPQVEKSKMTEEELAEEKDELLEALDNIEIDASGLPTKEERNLANRLKDLLSTNAIYKLNNVELKNLLKVLDNINNNYLPHYAQLMVEKLTAINNAKTLTSAIKKSVIAPLSGLYSRVKTFVSRSKRTAISEMIRRNPLFNIGEVFGDFKTKDIFNAVLNKVSEGEAKFKTDLKRIQNILEKAEERVAKSFKLDANKTLMSKFKMMTYMVQLEYDSNQGSKQVNPAAEYLKATIKHIDEGKSQFGERDANMLQEILDKYIDSEGNIDNEKLYKSFNEAEKSAIKDIRGVNESLREKAEYTAAIIRGDRINPLTNYVHLNVLHEHKPNDLTSGVAFVNDYNNAMRPSTKAKSLIERTGKVSPLNFDIFASAQRGAKFVLMDYNLTEPIRTARKTIKQTIANFEEEGRIPKEKRQIINAIDSAFEEATENVLTNTFVTNSFADDVIDYIKKQGYRAVLAGTGRFVSELTSNIGFAVIIDPKAFTTGIENRGFIMSVDAPLVMENVGSKQTNRVFPTDTLSGKLIDTNILQQASGIKGAKSKNPVANKIQQIWNLSGKKYVNTVELTADALISTPDKLIMRPMWFGSFANEFQKLTGEKVNFEKIASNDENYMEQYKSAIEKAKTIADEKSVMTGSTDNAFMGILKGTIKPDQSVTTRIFNNFNNFMTKFLIFEYITARAGINAAMGNGSLTKKQGVAVLGAVTTRMVVYTLLTQMLGSGLIGLFFDDDEEETEKSFMQKLGQSLTSAFTSLVFGRDFGNATKTIINYGLERANEKYLDFLREGEYDPYKDAIQYSIIPREKKGSITDISDLLLNIAGPIGPALKTGDLVLRKAFEPEKKESDAIQRQQDEINVRIPLEVLGNAGFIPLYKDIRKAVLKEMYSSLENPKKVINEKQGEVNQKVEALEKIKTNTKNKNIYNAIDEKINELQAGAEEKKNIKEENAEEKQRKEELLTNPVTGEKYDNESELKRYNKRLYNKNFGVRSQWYKEHRYEELVQKKMNLQIRKMEDRENRYRAPIKKTAKKRNSDGSFKRVSSR